MKSGHYPLNGAFSPSKSLMTLYILDFIIFILVMLLFIYIPVVLYAGLEPIINAAFLGVILVVVILFLIWTKLYYESMWYELLEDEVRWKRGVWFRATGIVPYNRITNIDLKQGPVMRILGISTVSLQTAGYSGAAVPEIRIEGIIHAEELREQIRNLVRGRLKSDDGTGTGSDGHDDKKTGYDQEILMELQRIRELIEKKS
jgi:membrane protein YdbS with pleckstrin-like domain